MHLFFDDTFAATDLGVGTRTFGRLTVDGGGGGTPPVQRRQPKQAEEPKQDAPKGTGETKATDAKPKPDPVTAVDRAREVIKDGRVAPREQTTFERKPVREAIDAETDRLTDAVVKAHGEDLKRDGSGRLVLEDGAPVVDEESARKSTRYEELVRELGETTDSQGLDVLNQEIRQLRDSKSPVGLDSLITLRDERRGAEQLVVGGIQDKLALVGALQAERLEFKEGAPKVARNDYEQLRTRAERWVEQFNDNGGRFDDSENFFTDVVGKVTGSDHETTEVDFDMLAERFHESPEALERFVGAQGLRDGDLQGKSTAEVEEYLGNLEDGSQAGEIALRYQAAQRLEGIFTTYNEARDVVEGNSEQVEQIDAEIDLLGGAISAEQEVLSSGSVQRLESSLASDGKLLVDAPKTEGRTQGGGDTRTGRNGDTDPKRGHPTNGGETGRPEIDPGMPTRTRTVEIDYADPEQAAKVLRRAQREQLLPSEHVQFNKQGEAVYSVQPGDSYWRISEQSSGKGGQLDPAHFLKNVEVNSQRFGRDPQQGIIHPDDQVVIQDRSLEQLVKLLELPATQEIESPAFMGRPGLQVY